MQAQDEARAPGVHGAAQGGGQDDSRRTDRDGGHAPAVESGAGSLVNGRPQERGHEDDRQDAQGQVEPEGPSPADGVCEPTAQYRTEHRSERPGPDQDTHVETAAPGRHDVGDDRLGKDHQPSAAQALYAAGGDEGGHVACQPAQHRAGEEQAQGAQQEGLVPDEVAQLAVERHHQGGGEDVGGGDPEHEIDAAEIADDGGKRRAEDSLVEGRQQHRREERDHDEEEPPSADRQRGCPGSHGSCLWISAILSMVRSTRCSLSATSTSFSIAERT